MLSPSGRFVLVYNGEVYNFNDIRALLETHGHTCWTGHSDTEVILAAFEKWGVKKSLEMMVGMFAFALWDRKERSLCLARDRMGEKPLYYGINNNVLYFGSDLRSFSASPFWRPEINQDALGLLMKHGYVPCPFSIYKEIYKLPAGSFVEIPIHSSRNGLADLPAPVRYWSFLDVAEAGLASPFTGSCSDALQVLEKKLIESVKLQMIADVPLGTFLSGGVDSSLVTALLQANSSKPVKSFSIGFKEKEYNEAHHAKRVAEHLGTDHTELYLSGADVMAVIPELPEIYSEPFADVSALPTTIVSRLAREKVTVCLSGDGGDELFCGYSRYHEDTMRWKAINHLPAKIRTSLSQLIERTPHGLFDILLVWSRLFRACDLGRGTMTASVKKLGKEMALSTFMDFYEFRMTGWTHPQKVVPGYTPQILFEERIKAMDDFTAMMTMDTISYLPDDILVKVDRAAMSASLESRVPLLDHRLVEFSASLPLSIKMNKGQLKWPLIQILHKYVPRSLVDRPKMGFGVPMGAWLRGPLKDWAEELLSEKRLKETGLVAVAPVRQLWADHLAGNYNYQIPLWSTLMFQAWQEKIKL